MRQIEKVLRDRPWLILAAAGGVAGAFIMYAGRGLSFHFDEWDFVQGRRGMSVDTFLSSHNGHLTALPIAYYKLMLQLFGLGHYWVYRLVVVFAHLLVVGLLYMLLRRRTGSAVAVLGALVLLFLGASWENLVWAMGVGFLGAAIAGLVMLHALDHNSRRGNIVASAALLGVFACSSTGIPFLVLATVELGLKRQWRRLLFVVGPPVLLYGLWYLNWGGGGGLTRSNISAAPAYVFDMAAAAFESAAGLIGTGAGPVLAIAAIVGLLIWLSGRNPSPRLIGALLGVGVFWTLTALARAHLAEPAAPRYLYPSVLLLLIAAAELWPEGRRVDRRRLLLAGGVVGLAAIGNSAALVGGAQAIRTSIDSIEPRLTALELVRPLAPAEYRPDLDREPQILAGKYFAAIDAFGSPAPTEADLIGSSAERRAAADKVLVDIVKPTIRPVSVAIGSLDCTIVSPGGEVVVGTGGVKLAVSSGDLAVLRARRFGDLPVEAPVGELRRSAHVSFPADASERPWILTVTGGKPVTACP